MSTKNAGVQFVRVLGTFCTALLKFFCKQVPEQVVATCVSDMLQIVILYAFLFCLLASIDCFNVLWIETLSYAKIIKLTTKPTLYLTSKIYHCHRQLWNSVKMCLISLLNDYTSFYVEFYRSLNQ